MGVIDMVFFRCFEGTVFHPMPDAMDKHDLIKTVLYPIKRVLSERIGLDRRMVAFPANHAMRFFQANSEERRIILIL